MSKQGMKQNESPRTRPRHSTPPVPEIQGKAKHGKINARPIIAGTVPPAQKVYHAVPHQETPISDAYPAIDNDLARDNLENDFPAADLMD